MKLGDASASCNQGDSDVSSDFIDNIRQQDKAWGYAIDAAKLYGCSRRRNDAPSNLEVDISKSTLRRRGNIELRQSDLVLIQNHTGLPWQSCEVSGRFGGSGNCYAVLHVKFTICAAEDARVACTDMAPCNSGIGRLEIDFVLQNASDPVKCGSW